MLAISGFGLEALIWWNLASLVFITLFSGVAAKRTVPQIALDVSDGVKAFSKVSVFTSGVIGYQILGNLLLLFERAWITRTLGPAELSYYVVAMSLGLYVLGFSNSLALVIAPLTSETQTDKERLKRVYKMSTKFTLIVVCFIVTAIASVRYEFLSLWIGSDFADRSSELLAIHLISFGLLSIVVVSWQMREGLGFPSHNLFITALYFLITITLMYLLAIYWDTLGVAIARLVGCGVMAAFIFQFERWLFGRILVSFWLKLFVALGIAMAAAAFVQTLTMAQMSLSWPALLLSAGLAGVAFLALLVLFRVIAKEDREIISAVFRR